MTKTAAQRTMRVLGTLQLMIGTASLVSPGHFAALYGMRKDMDGEAAFAWRIFAIRQLMLGTGNVANDASTRKANLAIQALDMGLFAATLQTGSVSRRTSLMALATATGAGTASALAYRELE